MIDVRMGQGVVVGRGCSIGEKVAIWNNSIIRDGVKIGRGSVIGHLVVIERDTTIGANTTIQSQCHITALAEIGDNCFFGPGVIMTNEKNIANQGRTTPCLEKAVIGDGVRIGAGCLLLPGVNIGDNAFVAAGSLVNKDIPSGEMWGGRPARRMKEVPVEEHLGVASNPSATDESSITPCAL